MESWLMSKAQCTLSTQFRQMGARGWMTPMALPGLHVAPPRSAGGLV